MFELKVVPNKEDAKITDEGIANKQAETRLRSNSANDDSEDEDTLPVLSVEEDEEDLLDGTPNGTKEEAPSKARDSNKTRELASFVANHDVKSREERSKFGVDDGTKGDDGCSEEKEPSSVNAIANDVNSTKPEEPSNAKAGNDTRGEVLSKAMTNNDSKEEEP